MNTVAENQNELRHPLYDAFDAAVLQAVGGKGERHGGGRTPFFEQQWVTLANCHGIGFLTGQSAKKLNEAAGKENLDDIEREILGAIVYAGMAYLHLQKMKKKCKDMSHIKYSVNIKEDYVKVVDLSK